MIRTKHAETAALLTFLVVWALVFGPTCSPEYTQPPKVKASGWSR
jgi:hypothetical protein